MAAYADPTTRYDHGILGDAIEHGALVMDTDAGRRLKLTLPQNRVFEDTAPRLVDVDGDSAAEVIVVETDLALGARLAVYGPGGLIAATDFIGRNHRWLAPVGAADFDGDGLVELAYVDRPHLAKTLKLFRFRNGKLLHMKDFPGVTNHRIGDREITGGMRDCGAGPQMIVADAGWLRVLALGWDGRRFTKTDLGPNRGPQSFDEALACR